MKVIKLIISIFIAILLSFNTLGFGYSLINYNRICDLNLKIEPSQDRQSLEYLGYLLTYPSSQLTKNFLVKLKGCE